jgi:arginyl-tRNA synthetase
MSTAIRSSLSSAVQAAFAALELSVPDEVTLERPARPEHGDWSTSVVLKTAKNLGIAPRDLAARLVTHLEENLPAHVTAIEIAGAGFLNFRLADSWLHDVLALVIDQGTENYARIVLPEARSVNVEYVSANPTGPLHAGHARWAAYGDALSRVLARAGYSVHREFYINDRGVQMDKFGFSLVARKWGKEPPEGGYVGQYIRDWAAEMPADANPFEWGYEKALTYQRETMLRMNVAFDTWSSERAIAESGAVETTLETLKKSGHVYDSTTPETDHRDLIANESSVEPQMATWLRTTSFGEKKKERDDVDRVIVKGDGTYTYLMPDIVYHNDKFSRGSLLIDILGADHHGYVARMKAAMQALGHERDDLEIIIGQNCVLLRDGIEVKLSKRTGDMLELAELLDELGADVAKLTFLLQSVDTKQTVDLDQLINKSLDNPVHYIHYAHARIHGIGRKAVERGLVRVPFSEVDPSLLANEYELDLLRMLADLPDVLAVAARERAPHKITTWVRELAATFQSFYAHCPVLRDDIADPIRQARLWLIEAARIGLAIGLDLLGVSAPERLEQLEQNDDLDEEPIQT